MNLWQELLKWFGGFAVLASALAWLIKNIITHALSKDLETFKAQLDQKLEDHKSQLETQRKSFEHNLEVLAQEHAAQFTQLHEKRVGLLAEMYYLLENTCLAMDCLKVGCEEPSGALVEGSTQDAVTKNHKLLEYFQRNKLYFSKALAQQIQTVVFALQNFPFDLAIVSYSGHKPEEVTQSRMSFLAEWKEQSPKLREAMGSVEDEFRRLLASDVDTFSRKE